MFITRLLVDTLLPDECVLCGMSQRTHSPDRLCRPCRNALPRNVIACVFCALPLTSPGCCGQCLRQPLTRGRAVVPLLHEAEARRLIHRAKFHHGMREARTLSEVLYQAITQAYIDDAYPEALLPMPMSWRGTLQRGYNQAAMLTRPLARQLQLPLYQPLHKRHTAPQRTRSRAERQHLQPSVFYAKRQWPTKRTPFRHIAIVDDVLTTGSTMRAISIQLEKQGIQRIDIWCATRAVWD